MCNEVKYPNEVEEFRKKYGVVEGKEPIPKSIKCFENQIKDRTKCEGDISSCMLKTIGKLLTIR